MDIDRVDLIDWLIRESSYNFWADRSNRVNEDFWLSVDAFLSTKTTDQLLDYKKQVEKEESL